MEGRHEILFMIWAQAFWCTVMKEKGVASCEIGEILQMWPRKLLIYPLVPLSEITTPPAYTN